MAETGLLSLPQNILSYLAMFLPFQDVKSFRLACLLTYEASFCKEFLTRVELKPKCLTKHFLMFCKKAFSGRFLSLSLHGLNPARLVSTVRYFSCVTDVSIDIQSLSVISRSCKFIKRLMLSDEKFCLRAEDMCKRKYKPLSALTHLSDLQIQGCNQVYSLDMLPVIASYCQSLTTLSVTSITFSVKREKKQHVLQSITSMAGIRHWSFQNVAFLGHTVILLPTNILSLYCVHTVVSPLDERHSLIERITLDGVMPTIAEFCQQKNFVNLKYLVIKNAYSYHSELPFCAKLEELRLLDCYSSFAFLCQLSPAVENSLRRLSIKSSNNNFNNKSILKILNKFKRLEELELSNMNAISVALCSMITHTFMKRLCLSNCKYFDSTSRIPEDLPYRLEIICPEKLYFGSNSK